MPRGRRLDLTGQRFGRLVAQRFVGHSGRNLMWACLCDCGKEASAASANLLRKATLSCGCLNRELYSVRAVTHGYARVGPKPAEYTAWALMKQRCTNPNGRRYKYYGARGITVCARWRDDFPAFLSDMGPKPTRKHSIDRIDNDGGYWCGDASCPDCGPAGRVRNCRWATQSEQVCNSRKVHLVTALGETMSIAAWSKRSGIKDGTIARRISLGWSDEEAVGVRQRDIPARRA